MPGAVSKFITATANLNLLQRAASLPLARPSAAFAGRTQSTTNREMLCLFWCVRWQAAEVSIFTMFVVAVVFAVKR